MIKQITVFLENEEGRLSAMCRTLSDAGVDLMALTIAESTEYGLVRLIAADPEGALAALKDADFRAIATDVVMVELGNEPGALTALLEKIDEADTNLEYAYCFAYKGDHALGVLKTDDVEATAVRLAAAGFSTLKSLDF